MPRTFRQRHEQGRQQAVPASVTACLDAVNTAGRADWHHRLDLVRAWRRTEYAPPADAEDMVRRHAAGLGPEAADPPHFEDAACWLIATGRDVDLYRCVECGSWFIARHNRAERCGAVACQRAHTRRRQSAYRRALRP